MKKLATYHAPIHYPRDAAEALAAAYNAEAAPDGSLLESWDDWPAYAVAEVVEGTDRYSVPVYTNDEGDPSALPARWSGAEQDGCIGWL